MFRWVFLLSSITSLLTALANAQGTVVVSAPSAVVTCTRFRHTGFWDVDIFNYPALPPECGPALSFNAVRDKSKLPAQICGIVGSYVFFLAATGTLLLTLGRKMRKRAEDASGRLKEIEMVDASAYSLGSPAASHRSWMRGPFRSLRRQSSLNSKISVGDSVVSPISPGVESNVSFDHRVVQKHRESSQAEMDRLYAAVMEYEEAKRSRSRIVSMAPSRDSGAPTADAVTASAPDQTGTATTPASELHADRPKNLRVQIQEHPTESTRSPGAWSQTTTTPRSPYRAALPHHPQYQQYPQSPGGFSFLSEQTAKTPVTPRTPFSPGLQRVELPDDMYPASPPPGNVRMQLPPPVPPKGRDPPSGGKSKRLMKNLRISGASSYRNESKAGAEDRQPLTPRLPENPPPPPSLPGEDDRPTPTPADGLEEQETYESERLDEPRPLPSSQPSRPIPPPLSLPDSPKASRSTSTLPLRQYASESSVKFANPLSPGPIKQTILERKPDRIRAGPMTGRTPRTGVPMTPYTPYMPFTPITPVTPGLVSRKERKERLKKEGRRVLVEEDEVLDEGEMWDGAY